MNRVSEVNPPKVGMRMEIRMPNKTVSGKISDCHALRSKFILAFTRDDTGSIDYVIWKFFDCLNPLIFIEGTNE